MWVDRLARFIVARAEATRGVPDGAVIDASAFIGRGVSFDWTHGHHITIERDVTIAAGARILCHDASSYRRTGTSRVAPVTIREGAFIGAGALILPGVEVGAGSVVAAGAVVTDDVAPGTVVAGVPARYLSSVEELDERRRQEARALPVLDASAYASPHLDEAAKEFLRAKTVAHGAYHLASASVAADYARSEV